MHPNLRSLAAATLLLVAVGFAQQDRRPAYEAATVKINTSGTRGSSSNGSRGQVLMSNQTMKRLIERAYGVGVGRVAGPDWMDEVRYDIAAKYPPDLKTDDRAAMLRALLEERFRLAAHRETRDVPGFTLEVGKGGFQLKPVAPGASHVNSDGDTVQTFMARKVSMALLADHLGRLVNGPVVDRTAIEGVYDFDLRWRVDETGGDDRSTAMFAGVQDALGTVHLRLRAQKVPVEYVVVDHVERVPSEN